MKAVIIGSALVAALGPALAHADARESYGVSASVGAGYDGFVDHSMSRYADGGAAWDVRLAFGTRTTFTLESAYVGSLHAVEAEGLANARIVSHGIEWGMRCNLALTDTAWPYLLVGVGWSRYRLDSPTSAPVMTSGDDTVVLPLGLGIVLRRGHALLDVRLVYRATSRTDMVVGEEASFSSWNAGARIGFEY